MLNRASKNAAETALTAEKVTLVRNKKSPRQPIAGIPQNHPNASIYFFYERTKNLHKKKTIFLRMNKKIINKIKCLILQYLPQLIENLPLFTDILHTLIETLQRMK